jgi:hypothetical protein
VICTEDAECEEQQVCLSRRLFAPGWFGSQVLMCYEQSASCFCQVTSDADGRNYCVESTELERFDCNVESLSCDTLSAWLKDLTDWNVSGSQAPRVESCKAKIDAALQVECGG